MVYIIRLGKVHINILTVIFLPCIVILEGSIYLVYIIMSAALHELAHILALKLMGVPLDKIEIHPFSVTIEHDEHCILGYRQEFMLAVAGPVCNAVLAMAVLAVGRHFPFYDMPFIIATNIMIFIINMMPVETLDGGRMLRCVLMSNIDVVIAEKICAAVSLVALVSMAIGGAFVFAASGWNLSLLGIALYLAFILYMKSLKASKY